MSEAKAESGVIVYNFNSDLGYCLCDIEPTEMDFVKRSEVELWVQISSAQIDGWSHVCVEDCPWNIAISVVKKDAQMKIFNWGISRERSGLKEVEEDHQRSNRKNSNSCVRSTRIPVTQKKGKSSCFFGKMYRNEKHPICMLNHFSRVCLCAVL